MRARFGAVGMGANKCEEMVTNTVKPLIITPETTFFTMLLKWIRAINDLNDNFMFREFYKFFIQQFILY
jgi:hypothetical protein